MQITRNSPIKININLIPNSTIGLKFVVKGIKRIIKIDISVIIYYKHPTRRTIINSISSDIVNIYTSSEDRAYLVRIAIPEFKRRIESFIIFRSEKLYEEAFIENIEIIGRSSQKIAKSKIEEIPIPKNPTIGEIIDNLANKYKEELPKDHINRIFYIRPWTNDSFGIVSHNHIQYIRSNIKERGEKNDFIIQDIDWSSLKKIDWNEKRNILLHPFLYPFASPQMFKQNIDNFAKLLAKKNKLGGFDVADSNRISQTAVDLVNRIDLMIVPSNFAKDAYIKSGVSIPVEVLPHGISDEFLSDNSINSNNTNIIELKKRRDKDNILVLYFVIHSGYRKGADIVKAVMNRIQRTYPNVYLIVRGNDTNFPEFKTFKIKSWLNNKDLVSLYDICDICISPSRGGGFELNAIEAVSRGLPTLVTNGGCFLDLIKYYIPIHINRKAVRPLPGNPIHTGYGFEVDIDDFEKKLTDVIDNLDHWKDIFKENSKEVKEKYTWRNTANILEEYLRRYKFVN